MIICSVCKELLRPSAFYSYSPSKGKKCKRCYREHSKKQMKGKPQTVYAPRMEVTPELDALHAQESKLDLAWVVATKDGEHEKAKRIRAKWTKVNDKITVMRKEN